MRKCATLEGGKIRRGKEPLIPSSKTFSLWEKAIGLRFRVTYPSPMGRRWRGASDEGFQAYQFGTNFTIMIDRKKTAFAKQLRHNQTSAETLIWEELRGRKCGGYKFRRQVPIGKYVVDFLCIKQKLIVEIDGPSHEDAQDYDANRTQVLEAMGYHVIRLSNDNVYEDLDATIEAIWQALENARP